MANAARNTWPWSMTRLVLRRVSVESAVDSAWRFARAEEQAGIVVSEREEHSMIPCMCQSCERRDLKSYVALSRVKSEREEFVVIVDGVKSRFEEHASFHVPRW
ncbi:unnamed protein product [Symbiodinium natans]|uniref:Uncharacterized protein n=1 Tax=Symbiodinium natans TaxID=878477 RepID=A0A812KMH5_9DINO|nr:unnamed protein product [Symbiodinium natans]